MIAGCDVNCHFFIGSCNHSGSTNDIIVWHGMELFQAVKNDNLLPKKYFFIGDGAFTNTTQFLSPWPGKATILPWFSFLYHYSFLISELFYGSICAGRGLDRGKDSFNYWFSHSCQTIE